MVHQGLTRRDLLLALPLLPACATLPLPSMPAPEAPAIPREFRAAWVATVANIDWPSRKGLSDAEQQAEVRGIVARSRELGLNALILQVRTSADALYASPLEPWSEYLSGTQGVAPGYDPLAYWIEQAHAAGLELHAWFNPYRARQLNAKSDEAASHLAHTQPQWVKRYGKQLWIDPGEPGAMQHSLAVFRDVLTRYAVDGIHIDDYFYPYPEKNPDGSEVDFPDDATFAAHGAGMERAAWRRQNVDRLVQAMHALVREVRPAARLGISPFGLMKPSERPEGIQGFSQYDKLYADVELWLREGWLDYLVPQLYWSRAQVPQAFGSLLAGWMRLNPKGKPIWPGLYTSRITAAPTAQAGGELQAAGDTRGWLPEEVSGQIALTRELNPNSGHVHFSMACLTQDRRGVVGHLREKVYAEPALPPAFADLPALPAPALDLLQVEGGWQLRPVDAPKDSLQRAWLWWREQGRWRGEWQAAGTPFPWPAGADMLVASGLNLTGSEGPRRAWKRPQ